MARQPYFKQKPRLYLDENFPAYVARIFRQPHWRKKIKVTTAIEEGHLSQPDRFHYAHCQRHRYTLVTLDEDFNNDRLYPFTHGKMAGVIMIRASSAEVLRIADVLSRLLEFVLALPFPKFFLMETKFLATRDSVIMRSRDTRTKEIKTLYVTAGKTSSQEIREFFSY